MPDRFTLPVVDLLRSAGWYEGRTVSDTLELPPEFSLFSQAQVVFAEFGGLHMGQAGIGIDCAKCDVEIDPCLGSHLAPHLKRHEQSLKTKLYPLGEVVGGHAYLVIDEQGRTYLYHLGGELAPKAPTFARGLELLLLGKKASQQEIESAWQPKCQQTTNEVSANLARHES
jgi:hypothetical protein